MNGASEAIASGSEPESSFNLLTIARGISQLEKNAKHNLGSTGNSDVLGLA
jgi:hypothetical protein